MNSLNCTEENGVMIVTPNDANTKPTLAQNKDHIHSLLKQHGIVLLRNFPVKDTTDFQKIILEDLNFEYWYPHKGSEFILNRVRKFVEDITGKNDYRTYSGDNTILLGNAENSVQGPHTESGTFKVRPKYLTMYCETTSEGAAQTAIYDLHKAYNLLSDEEKHKYNHVWNQFIIYTKPLGFSKKFFAKLIFNKMGKIKPIQNNALSLNLEKTPLVCSHPEKNLLCLQPWAFYNNTALAVHNAARNIFPERTNIKEPDRVACAGKSEWKLVDDNEQEISWTDEEKLHFFEKIFQTAKIHQWQTGDILILDNVYYGHGRLEDNGGQDRKIHQIQLNPIDMGNYAFKNLNR